MSLKTTLFLISILSIPIIIRFIFRIMEEYKLVKIKKKRNKVSIKKLKRW